MSTLGERSTHTRINSHSSRRLGRLHADRAYAARAACLEQDAPRHRKGATGRVARGAGAHGRAERARGARLVKLRSDDGRPWHKHKVELTREARLARIRSEQVTIAWLRGRIEAEKIAAAWRENARDQPDA